MRTRCLFLACSGVRVKSAELSELGVTLPGFIERGKVIASLPSLGLLTIASFCPEHWELKYVETADIDVFNMNSYKDYDLIAISSMTAQVEFAYQISDFLRANGKPVVMGGLHVSAMPEEAQEHATSIVVGEGEYAFEQLCKDFDAGVMKPRYNGADFGAFDFKDARVPRYDLLDMNKYNRITVQSQRGCPRKCNFCASSHTISNYKVKPVSQVIREIQEIAKFWPHPFIELADDNTFLSRNWAKDLMQAMAPLKIRWFTETDISVADDDELLRMISEAGCYQILIGLESASSDRLQDVDPAGWKKRQFAKYKNAIDKIQSYGISVNGCFIMGWDSDDRSTFERTRQFIEELELAEVQLTISTPFPNTPYYHQLKKQNRLFKDRFWDSCTLFDLNYTPARMQPLELEQEFYSLLKKVYSAEATSKRRAIFKKCVLNKRELRRAQLGGVS